MAERSSAEKAPAEESFLSQPVSVLCFSLREDSADWFRTPMLKANLPRQLMSSSISFKANSIMSRRKFLANVRLSLFPAYECFYGHS